jgi:glycosyltransferase involved in cell wall biosynthesis
MESIKILYIACGSGCDTTMGGSLIRTIEIAKRLDNTENVLLLTTSGGKQAIKHLVPNNLIFEIKTNICNPNNEKHFLIKLLFSYILILIRFSATVEKIPQVDIVYLDSDGVWDIFPSILYKKLHPKTKLVSMNHHIISLRKDNFFTYTSSTINILLQKVGQYLISKFSDAVFVLNTQMGERIKNVYLKTGYKGKIFKVENGIDVKSISQIQEQDKKYDACFFGYLRPSKGLYQIIPIWRKVASVKPDANLIIIGGILLQYKKYLQKEINKYSLNKNIIFTDYITSKKNALIKVKQSKVCISPSQEEGWGIALIECMSAGLPGIIWELDTFKNILKNGVFKIKKYNISAFSNQIIQLLNNDIKREELGQKAKESTYQYDWCNIAKHDLKYFNIIINS